MFKRLRLPALFCRWISPTSPAGLPLRSANRREAFDEETIYAAAQAFESATEWHSRGRR